MYLGVSDSADGSLLTSLSWALFMRLDLDGLEHVIIDELVRGFKASSRFKDFLPDQLLLHVRHTNLSWLPLDQQIPKETLGELFLSLATLGFSLVARDDSGAPNCGFFLATCALRARRGTALLPHNKLIRHFFFY
jgi:hypothetical protein